MRIPRTFIHPEKLKQHVDVTSTLCGCLPDKKHPTTARLHASYEDRSKNLISNPRLMRNESYENILSEKGIQYRMNRSIQVEGAFGVLKNKMFY